MKMLFAFVAAALGLGIGQAHAQQYVCSLTIQPSAVAPQYGRHGYVTFNASFSPTCASVSQQMLCTAGATSNLCGANAKYDETSLGDIFQALRSAQATHQQVSTFSDYCVGAGNNTSCIEGINFSSNP